MGFMPWEMRFAALLVLGMWQFSHFAPGMNSPAVGDVEHDAATVQGLTLRVAGAAVGGEVGHRRRLGLVRR